MPNYKRPKIAGGTYFITQVTHKREPWLCTETARQAIKQAIKKVKKKYPFTIEAFILLPDHFHCIWTLPPEDADFSMRLRLIKSQVTRHYKQQTEIKQPINESRQKRKEKNLWQRRFWEHLIRDERDFQNHCDYIHYNPVKHGLCKTPQEWKYSTIHRFIAQGIYPIDWTK